jgi:hypothetical protein
MNNPIPPGTRVKILVGSKQDSWGEVRGTTVLGEYLVLIGGEVESYDPSHVQTQEQVTAHEQAND